MIENTPPPPPSGPKKWWRLVFFVALIAALLALGQWASQGLIKAAGLDLDSGLDTHMRHVQMIALLIFTVLMAIPFMPAIEISLALLAAFGPDMALVIYAATVVALTISFTVGHMVPMHWIERVLRALNLCKAARLVHRLGPLAGDQRIKIVLDLAPKRFIPTLLKHRYLTVAVVLNVPGNAIIGGGGGISMVAGMSRLFTTARFVLTVAIAALPMPFIVWMLGGSLIGP